MTMTTTIINLNTAIEMGLVAWNATNACEFRGVIPGFVCGFNVEITNGEKTDYCSATFTNDYATIEFNGYDGDCNDLGLCLDFTNYGDKCKWRATGRVIFRGYYISEWDWEEKDYGFLRASDKAMLTKEYRQYKEEHRFDSKPLTYNPFVGLAL